MGPLDRENQEKESLPGKILGWLQEGMDHLEVSKIQTPL
jgi:hypothetical protein